MKKVFLLIAVVGMAIAQGFSKDAKDEQQPNPNAPVITFDQTTFDFGTIPYNGNGECEFVFTNTGKEPLIIQNCPSTCGCTVPTCPKNKPIKPGDKEVIKVKYNNTNIPGSFTKFFTVYSNATESQVTITIKGIVAAKE